MGKWLLITEGEGKVGRGLDLGDREDGEKER